MDVIGVLTWERRNDVPWYWPATRYVAQGQQDSGWGVFYEHLHLICPLRPSKRRDERIFRLLDAALDGWRPEVLLVARGFPHMDLLSEREIYWPSQFAFRCALRGMERLMRRHQMKGGVLAVVDGTPSFLNEERLCQLGRMFHTIVLCGCEESPWEERMMEQYGIPVLTWAGGCGPWADCLLCDGPCAVWPTVPVFCVGRQGAPQGSVNGYRFHLPEEQKKGLPVGMGEMEFLGTLWERGGVEEIGELHPTALMSDGQLWTFPRHRASLPMGQNTLQPNVPAP